MTYVPMTGPLPGVRYMPSNSDAGYSFIEAWCANCERDKPSREGVDFDTCEPDEVCAILSASFADEAVEWRDLGERCVCLAYVPAGQPIPPPRDDKTIDMFGKEGA